MPAQAFEADEALAEGIKIRWLTTIKEIGPGELVVEKMRLDAQGRPQPSGEYETLTADSLVLALGQQADSGFLRKAPGIEFLADDTVIVNSGMMTGRPGIFAGGDMVPSDRTVTAAVGHGKKAARHVDAWLRGQVLRPAPKHPIVRFGQLHLPIYTDAPASTQPELPVAERLDLGFVETVAGLSETEAAWPGAACPAAIASSATNAMPHVPSRRSTPSWVRAGAIASTMTAAPAAPPASSSVPAMRSR